ncbi:MAG TPA: DUF6265 family protein [Acidobacteriota bacterium]|jgi:uncharacterized protein YndB with AHSA1/START domain
MNHRKNIRPTLMAVLILVAASFSPLAAAGEQVMRLSDFSFLAGRWSGQIKAGKVEQEWSTAQAGLMMGMFHLYDNDKTLVLEFMSLRQTPESVVLHLRHFSPDLKTLQKDDAIQLRGIKREDDSFFFENPVHNSPKRSTIKRLGKDHLLNRAEIIRDDGSVNVIEVELRRILSESQSLPTDVVNTSYVTPAAERVLRHEVIVNTTLEDAWKALTTSEGLKSFMAPTAEVELREGGKFHSNYTVGSKLGDPGTIYNQVLSFIPMKMFSIKIGLTDQFPAEPRQAGTLFAVLEFEDLGNNKVRVIESMIGWKTGPDWDKTYEFFNRGNAYTLKKLQQRFVEGPVNWNKAGAPKK